MRMTRSTLTPSDAAAGAMSPVRRRTFLAAALAAAAAASGACGFGDDGGSSDGDGDGDGGDDGGTSGEPQRGGTLRLTMLPVTHIDPAVSGNASSGQIIMIGLWEGLVVNNADDPSEMLPGVAESWDVSDDGLVYTFHLRSDAKWSNGDPVTAHDFEWNWQRGFTPGVAGEGAPSFSSMARIVAGAEAYFIGESEDWAQVGVKALDDATFEVTLEEPYPDFVTQVGQYWALPLHPATVQELGEAWLDPDSWVSNGAYVLDSFRVNQGAVLLPNPEYWDADSYYLDRWEISFNDGGTTADLLSYGQDQIDITGRIEDDLESVTTSDFADELISSATNQIRQLVVINSHNPALHDVRVRNALAISIDREALGDLAKPAIPGNSRVPAAVPGFDDVTGMSYDVDQAQALLADAGYPDGDGMPTITLLDFQSSPWVEAIAEMWRQNLGINVELDILEIGVYQTKREEVHDENYTGFFVNNVAVNPPSLYSFVRNAVPAAPGINGANLINPAFAEEVREALDDGAAVPEIVEMIEGNRYPEHQNALDLATAAMDEDDPDAQHDLLVQAASAWNETYTIIPVLWGGYNLLIKPRVKNIKPWMFTSVFTTKGIYLED